MPNCVQWISFAIGLLSFGISVKTLQTSLSVKKQIHQKYERSSFKKKIKSIVSEIDGFINSINEDHIFNLDKKKVFRSSISRFLVDLETSYTFLSKTIKRESSSLHKRLNNPNLTMEDWNGIAERLIGLKNRLKKEIL